MSWNLRNKLLIPIVGLILLGCLVLGYLTYAVGSSALRASIANDAKGETKGLADVLELVVRTEIIGNGLNIPYPQRDLHVYHHNGDGTPLTDIITKGVADDGDVAKPA